MSEWGKTLVAEIFERDLQAMGVYDGQFQRDLVSFLTSVYVVSDQMKDEAYALLDPVPCFQSRA